MAGVANIWRHPIKSHGREALDSVELIAGKTMPWDRHWAVTHGDPKFDTNEPGWVSCRNFMIGSSTSSLAGIWAELDEATGNVTLRHQNAGSVTFNPNNPEDIPHFLDWVTPLCPADRRQPNGIVKAPDRGMTDSPDPTVSIMTKASHRAVEGRLGRALETERWRGNIWLDGPAAWEEMEWTGKNIRIGKAVLEIGDPIQRCSHTNANPTTGTRDTDLPSLLRDCWDHDDFGMYATVVQTGEIKLGDTYEVL